MSCVISLKITRGADLVLDDVSSASAGTISVKVTSKWGTANSSSNLQYGIGPQFGHEEYTSYTIVLVPLKKFAQEAGLRFLSPRQKVLVHSSVIMKLALELPGVSHTILFTAVSFLVVDGRL